MKNVSAYTDKLIVPTYELLEDDLNPMFDKLMDPYPYTLQGSRSSQKTEKEYDVLILENEYLKLTVIPSLGGRLYSAFDKISGKEVFYKNPVIKPRMIAKRGAWFSGGVEFNFPFGHAPSTMDRVNCTFRQFDDGSASILLGNIELLSFMQWQVELKLYPGKAYIEENVRLYNPTAYENSFFFWSNAAVEYNENVKLIYPFDWCINMRESKYIKWPYYNGINCSNITEMPCSYETFGKLPMEDFFGIYDYRQDQGVVHHSNRKKLKGAKFFTWGHDGLAHSWYKALTDGNSPYFEIQSGPFETQKVFKFLKPHQELQWSECWYPVSGMNGFKHASRELAINYNISGKLAEFKFYATEQLKDCVISLQIQGKKLVAQRSFSPHSIETVNFTLDQTYITGDRFELDVYCGSAHLASLGKRNEYSEEYPDIDIYEDSRILIDKESENKLFNTAVRLESFRRPEEAIAIHLENLKANPCCTLTLNRLGRLYLKKSMPDKAGDCFKKVLSYDNRNSEARFLLAITEKEKGNLVKARKLMFDTAFGEAYYEASVIELVKLDIALGYFKEAASILENHDPEKNNYITFLYALCLRKDNLQSRAIDLLNGSKYLDEYICMEKYLLDTIEKKDAIIAYTGRDEKVLFTAALEYTDLRQYEDALALLNLIEKPGFKSKLLEAFIYRETGKPVGQLLQDALNSSLDHVFINEKLLVRFLVETVESDMSGKIDYLLGTYDYSAGRRDESLEYLLSAYRKGLRYTVLLRNIGYLYYHYKSDKKSAASYFEEDLLVNNGINEDTLNYLDRIYSETYDIESRKKLIPYMENVKNRSFILPTLVGILSDSGNMEKALAILENEEFENWEGGETSGQYYKRIILEAALRELEAGNFQTAKNLIDKAELYPARLNYGDSVKYPLSDLHYYKGIIYSKAGDKESAIKEFKKGFHELDSKWAFITEKSRSYSYKCLEELQKRGCN